MSQVIKISDSTDLIETKSYPHGKWDFDKFNPIQSRLLDVYDSDANVAVAAATSAGKTVCAELYLAHQIRTLGGKGVYVGPLKALVSEKQQDWSDSNHHFGDLNIAIVTGDFRFTSSRVDEVDRADLVVMTPEMLASRLRNFNSDKSQFLKDVRVVAFDESHLLTVPSRGHHIEVALMKLAEINPDIRIVLLSATMPNVDELCEWISKLTNRDTHYLQSEFRPVPLNIHYETYYDGGSYDAKEYEKVSAACAIVNDYPDDKFLIFVHTKRTGNLMIERLTSEGLGDRVEFHNADLPYAKRKDLEDRFKNHSKLRIVVATSTLAWGVNLPARRVIITGVHRGLDIVENYDIQQMVGRAGRPRYDPVGDAYILVPESAKKEWITQLRRKTPIRSTLLDYVGDEKNPHYKTLAFHIVSEIHYGNVKTKEAFHEWFKTSLAHHQANTLDNDVVDRTIKLLEQHRAIVTVDGEYRCTAIGKIASMFYYSPFDVFDLWRNFSSVFEQSAMDDDFVVAMALGNVDSFRWGIVSRNEREQMATFESKIKRMFEYEIRDPAIKYGFAYFNLLKGRRDIPYFQAIQNTVLVDLDRTMQVINAIDSMAGKWEQKDWFKTLRLRLHYGVGPELVELCQIPNVGQVRAKRLKAKNIDNLSDFLNFDAAYLAKVMKCSSKVAQEAIDGAKTAQLKEAAVF